MKNRHSNITTVFLLTALLVTGCSGNSYNASKGGGAEAAQIISDSAMDKGLSTFGEEAKETSAAMDSAPQASEDTADPEEAGIIAPDISQKDLSDRKLIKTVSLSLETKTFDTLKKQIEESVASFGGYIESSSYDAPQGRQYRYYYLCVRIPSEHLDEFVGKAGELGTVTNQSEHVEDVTLDYVDKTAYKDSLRTEYERVMELLEQAEDLEQILALESKLSQLRYEINSYESQLRTYDNQIDYSTVNVSISEVQYEQETDDSIGSRIRSGFRNSLFAVRDFFVNTFVFLVSSLPVLLPAAAAVVLILVLLKKGWGRFRKK